MASKYLALEHINYDTIQFNTTRSRLLPHHQSASLLSGGRGGLGGEDAAARAPSSLLGCCCAAVCRQSEEFVGAALNSIPVHLAPMLLRQAMEMLQPAAVVGIISNWPLAVLCFREVLPECESFCGSLGRDVFEEEMGLDLAVFKGVTSRTRFCKMTCLDFRGLNLSWTFIKLIVQMWPILSLRKTQRNMKRLTTKVLKKAGLKRDNNLAKEIIPSMLQELLDHEMTRHPKFLIRIPRGEKLVVRVDHLEFSTQNTFFMDYLLTSCLQDISPLIIVPSNLIITPSLLFGDEVLNSLAPFIVFRGHNRENLEGIWLENLQENIFFMTFHDLQPFTDIRALGAPNCNIILQEGCTRQRTLTRSRLTSLLSRFTNLVRLDVSQNCFSRCLGEVLDCLRRPLEYLSVAECAVVNEDIVHLSTSQHAKSLRHVDFTRICGIFLTPEMRLDENWGVGTTMLMSCMEEFSNIAAMNISRNQLGDQNWPVLLDVIRSRKWPTLKTLNLSGNVLNYRQILEFVRTCGGVACFQKLHVSYDSAEVIEIGGRLELVNRVGEVLTECRRGDIEVNISPH